MSGIDNLKPFQFKPGHKGGPGRPPDKLGRELRQLTQDEFRDIATMVLRGDLDEVEEIADDRTQPILKAMIARSIMTAYHKGDFYQFDAILNRIIGRVSQTVNVSTPTAPFIDAKKSFEDFCEAAKYPRPYEKQVEMKDFLLHEEEPRILLGARGYGKTDYMTILGVAYDVYCNPADSTNLIISKSKTRNTAMIDEIGKALIANGVTLDIENASCIRVAGMIGKDHSIEALTIKSSFRGRHPKRIIMDDPVTEEDTSDAVRLLVKKKYDEAYKLSKNICVIGQPAHAFDLYSDLRPILKKMEVPHGTILELDADLEAMKLAGVDLNSIEMSYHLRVPKNSSSSFADVSYIESFPGRDSVAFIDPSFEGGDYTAMTVLTKHFDGVAIQGHVWKRAWNHCIDEMVERMRSLGVKKLCFETNSLGDQPLQLLRSHPGIAGIGVMGKKSTENKHARIMAAGVFAKLIHLSQNSDKIYIDQVVKYEYKAKFDDAPDSLASCMEWVGLIKGKSR